MMAGRSTIRDVARAAGLSIASVSRTLANPESVREATRIRVLEAARALDFQVNRQAVDFRRGRSNALIVLVSDIANPFYSEFFSAIEAEARKRGFMVLIGDTASDPDSEESYVAMLWAGKADGLISNIGRLPKGLPSPEHGAYRGPPIVSCNRDAGEGIPTVRIDNYEAGKTVGRHLVGLGHTLLAQIHGPLRHDDYLGRFNGFIDGLAEGGAEQEAVIAYEGDQSVQSGRDGASWLMSRAARPTAIFVHSDEMALGVLQQLNLDGYRVPRDVSLVGFDDLNYAAALTPPLTTMRIPRVDWGRAACTRLIDEVVSGAREPGEVTIAAQFMLRGSTGHPPRSGRRARSAA
jgi:LacI family repressor for deo operon, udp, cdd, tsx, nupC, and nupG